MKPMLAPCLRLPSNKVCGIALITLSSLLIGCSTTRTKPANVIDRTKNTPSSVSTVESTPAGYYRVKKGDTLFRIALDQGQSYRDLVQWNNLSDPNQIEVDQLILVKAPSGFKQAGKASDKKPSLDKSNEPVKLEAVKADPAKGELVDPSIHLSWPAKGKVVEEFSEGKNKGIDIAGKLGDPVQAAADGKVVYAGNSLRGYGNLIIVKHDNTYLTAYAYNRSLLLKEGDSVRKGQKIAEMGDTDTNSVKLHFELRMNGKPVNPLPYLQ